MVSYSKYDTVTAAQIICKILLKKSNLYDKLQQTVLLYGHEKTFMHEQYGVNLYN